MRETTYLERPSVYGLVLSVLSVLSACPPQQVTYGLAQNGRWLTGCIKYIWYMVAFWLHNPPCHHYTVLLSSPFPSVLCE